MKKKNIAIDFDGVINTYDGWRGETNLFQPQAGVTYFLKKLCKEYNVIIFTCRDTTKIDEWLEKYKLDKYITTVTNEKPKAVAYIDDRAICYDGSYSDVLSKLEEFKTWWEQ